MFVREIESAEELESLRDDWLALWKRSPTATPFQSPDWLIPWWKYFGSGRLHVLVLMDETRLVGLAPLFITPTRKLHLLGTGNTDYLDILLDDRFSNDVAIFTHLCETQRAWDECDLQNLRESSPLLTMHACAGFVEQIEEQNFCPVASLPASTEEFLDSLPRQLRHNLSYYHRKLSTLGDVQIERAGEHNFAELFEAFLKLHEARWRMNNMT